MTLAPDPHEEFEELLGAYALDAVDGEERERLEDHLRDCPRCRAEVEQHREVAAHLAYAGSPAPEGLWARIASSLEPGEPSAELAALYPLRRPPSRRPQVVGYLAAAAVVVVALGVFGWQVHRDNAQVGSLRSALAGSGVNQAAHAASVDPRARMYMLTSADGRTQVTGVLEPDGSGFILRGAALPPLPAGETYQLWGIVGGRAISLGLLGASPDVVAFHAVSPTVTALAITTERGGGAIQPTGSPVVTGRLPPV